MTPDLSSTGLIAAAGPDPTMTQPHQTLLAWTLTSAMIHDGWVDEILTQMFYEVIDLTDFYHRTC